PLASDRAFRPCFRFPWPSRPERLRPHSTRCRKMIRFQSVEDGASRALAGFRRKLQKSFPRFLAYCSIMRACRSIPQVRFGQPVAVGLVVPDGSDVDIYEDAARYAAHGVAIMYVGDDGTYVVARTANRKKLADEVELSKALSAKRRVVVVAE